ncbi:hypothetical protein DFH06DRAFT_1208417 [Mycena polygramma]|nr:hypothetical protein DFH06DRAFT_1208417 [Mycena polygramma]
MRFRGPVCSLVFLPLLSCLFALLYNFLLLNMYSSTRIQVVLPNFSTLPVSRSSLQASLYQYRNVTTYLHRPPFDKPRC